MARDQVDMTPIRSRDELVAWFEAGCKPKSEFRVGTEHEKFPFRITDHSPVPYAGSRGIRALLDGMKLILGWEPIMEGDNIIGLADVTGGGAISLEPGGQFELSGAPVDNVHQTAGELFAHLAQVREVAGPLGIGFLGLGMTPRWTRADIPVMPKGRYRIMTAYMPKVGKYALDVPMHFIKRGDSYIDVYGKWFRDHLKGKLVPGETATISDWANHVSTIFPEVRLKRYIEMRGSDGGPWRRLPSLPAFWVGLIYDDLNLDACWEIVKDWSAEERQKLRDDVPKLGFKAKIRNRTLLDLAGETLQLAEQGLVRRKRFDRNARDETRYLRVLQESVARGMTPAEELLEKFHGAWNGSIDPIFFEYAY